VATDLINKRIKQMLPNYKKTKVDESGGIIYFEWTALENFDEKCMCIQKDLFNSCFDDLNLQNTKDYYEIENFEYYDEE